jgi:hypothetical protein
MREWRCQGRQAGKEEQCSDVHYFELMR